eukprot:m.497426 g.497426  ORF g.497426 m.497426 type:complete len:126 (-) comp57312_c0_seq21:1943-2320(-)
MFVFGLSSSATIIHRKLPLKAMTCLNTKKFETLQQSILFEAITRKWLASSLFSLQIGAQTFHQLVYNFLNKHLSVQTTLKAVKYYLIQHFSKHECSFITTPQFCWTPARHVLFSQVEWFKSHPVL